MKRVFVFLVAVMILNGCNSNEQQASEKVNQSPSSVSVKEVPAVDQKSDPNSDEIVWMSFEAAVSANAVEPKKIFVDVYTDWCGWCKVMDKQTFTDPEVIAYMNEHFYAVKFNAEQRDPVTVNGKVFEYMPNVGRRGVHTLAYSLLQGRMSYPSVVYMDEQLRLINVSPGFKRPDQILPELKQAVGAQPDS